MLLRVIPSAIVLAVLNGVGIAFGLFIARGFGATDPSNFQVAFAFTGSVAGFLGWIALLRHRGWRSLLWAGWAEGIAVFALPLLLVGAGVEAIYLAHKGFLSVSNLWALWMFQMLTNVVAVGSAAAVWKTPRADVHGRRGRS